MKQSFFDHVMVMTSDIRADRRMLRSLRTLKKHYKKIHVVCRYIPDRADQDNEHYEDIHFVRCWFKKGPLFYMEFLLRSIGHLRRLQFESMSCVDADTLLVGAHFKNYRNIETYFDAHEYFSEVPELEGRPVVKWIWQRVTRFGLRFINHAYTVSEELATALGGRYGRPFDVVRNVPECAAVDASVVDDDDLKLVYLGVLNKGRGLIEILSAMKGLTGLTLDLYGEGDLSGELRMQVDEMGLSEKVTFHGWIKPESIPQLLASCDIGLNLLDGASKSYRKSLANKFFDYIHAGIPILTMDFEAYRKINEAHNVAWLIPDLNVESLTEILVRLRDTKAEWQDMKVHCRKARQIYCWEREAPRLLAIHGVTVGSDILFDQVVIGKTKENYHPDGRSDGRL